jgi:SNF2 family DNA or RNA helicase
MQELWTLLNFINPGTFDNLDQFLGQYGDMKSQEIVSDLHETIRPYILRRLKEDVEKSVPPKEETLIEVELTVLQKQYYRAVCISRSILDIVDQSPPPPVSFCRNLLVSN